VEPPSLEPQARETQAEIDNRAFHRLIAEMTRRK
jgi:hypothetical protein